MFHMASYANRSASKMLGGKERDPDEYARLCANAGFQLNAIIPTASTHSVIEARPV